VSPLATSSATIVVAFCQGTAKCLLSKHFDFVLLKLIYASVLGLR
jgi:hypothetical protein